MNSAAGNWYKQSFADQIIYFRASGARLKNGNVAGLQVQVELGTRRRPRAKAISVASSNYGLWRTVPLAEVPPEVLAAAAAR